MSSLLILNAQVVNEGATQPLDVFIKNGRIERIDANLSGVEADKVIDATGHYLLPGAIDDQVHFREPGLTHKATLYTEAKAAVAGGITSFMEMPNTVPQTTTQELLEEKYSLAAKNSLANYSFYMGTTNHNYEELMRTDPSKVCGIKIFMGSSTGDMLVDDKSTLSKIFANSPCLIATHCEDDKLVKQNLESLIQQFGDDIPVKFHPLIRSAQACYNSSSMAVALAKKHGTRLHILHISTARELELFDNALSLDKKKITSEACIHHLWFSDADYATKGNLIKWNPAVKTAADREAVFQAVLDGKIDVIATDHAPHTWEEKQESYLKAPSGGPLVQHALVAMLDFYHQGKIPLETIVQKMSHNVAILYGIQERGFIREGYWADLVLVKTNAPWEVQKSNVLYKCGWSPFEGHTFQSQVTHTIVSGHLAYEKGQFDESVKGKRLLFARS